MDPRRSGSLLRARRVLRGRTGQGRMACRASPKRPRPIFRQDQPLPARLRGERVPVQGPEDRAIALSAGSHSLTASYAGSATYAPSTSPPVTESVGQLTATTTSLTAAPNPSTPGQNVTLTATVTPAAATGTVSFLDGANLTGNRAPGQRSGHLLYQLANKHHPLAERFLHWRCQRRSEHIRRRQSVCRYRQWPEHHLARPRHRRSRRCGLHPHREWRRIQFRRRRAVEQHTAGDHIR
ncbi:hypothetical protein SBA4_280019 [Candidatus Sulfopaludibacter sp. SbA4]|nr:hypothetical protein SBA4_280019 [Candidatus Sulfopaludibacter sp. SbA4]